MLKRVFFLVVPVLWMPLTLLGQQLYVVSFAGVGGPAGAALMATQYLGLFEKYGLNADPVFIAGGARGIQSLLGGSTHFYTGDAIAPMSAALRGGDVVIIGATQNTIPGGLIARKDIRKPSDLMGKKIGIVNFGGSNELSVVLALKKWNIPREAVVILPSGSTADRLSALMRGALDATPLAPPLLFQATRRGMNILIDFEDIAPFPQNSIAVRRSFLRENREKVKSFLQAYSEMVFHLITDKQKATSVYRKGLRQEDPSILEETHSYYRGRLSFPPRVVRGEGMQLAAQMSAQRLGILKSDIDLEQFLDESLTDELEKEGFFKKFVKR